MIGYFFCKYLKNNFFLKKFKENPFRKLSIKLMATLKLLNLKFSN